MTEFTEQIYIVTTRAAGSQGRGPGRGLDGYFDLKCSRPEENDYGTGLGLLPAADRAACFEHAVGLAALRLKRAAPDDTAIEMEFDLCIVDGAHPLRTRLHVRLPGLPPGLACKLAGMARQTCPYPGATRSDRSVAADVG